jgi:hypothetical protein
LRLKYPTASKMKIAECYQRKTMDFTERRKERRVVASEAATKATESASSSSAVGAPESNAEATVLVFDSERQPVTPGLRARRAVTGRQLLYRWGSVCIDLRMQPTPGSERIVLIGQLLDSNRPTYRFGQVPVSLLSKGSVVSRRETNDNGEFDFGFEQLQHGQLVFGLRNRNNLTVPVPD